MQVEWKSVQQFAREALIISTTHDIGRMGCCERLSENQYGSIAVKACMAAGATCRIGVTDVESPIARANCKRGREAEGRRRRWPA